MKAADTDRLVGEAQRGVGRAQPLTWITRSLPAQVHEAVERDSDLAEVRPEQIPDEAGVEIVAARRDGRMRREHDARAGDKACFLERHLARRPQLANALDGAEEAVAFVEVEHARVDAQRA